MVSSLRGTLSLLLPSSSVVKISASAPKTLRFLTKLRATSVGPPASELSVGITCKIFNERMSYYLCEGIVIKYLPRLLEG